MAEEIEADGRTLGPEWKAAFTVYWRVQLADEAECILALIESAAVQMSPERSVYQLQKALRRLGLMELQIIRLLLSRYAHWVREDADRPAQRIAVEVRSTLRSIHTRAARKPRSDNVRQGRCGPCSPIEKPRFSAPEEGEGRL